MYDNKKKDSLLTNSTSISKFGGSAYFGKLAIKSARIGQFNQNKMYTKKRNIFSKTRSPKVNRARTNALEGFSQATKNQHRIARNSVQSDLGWFLKGLDLAKQKKMLRDSVKAKESERHTVGGGRDRERDKGGGGERDRAGMRGNGFKILSTPKRREYQKQVETMKKKFKKKVEFWEPRKSLKNKEEVKI